MYVRFSYYRVSTVRKLFAPVYLAVISPYAHRTGGSSPRLCLRLSTTVGKSHRCRNVFESGGARHQRLKTSPTPKIHFLLGFRPLYFRKHAQIGKKKTGQEKKIGQKALRHICTYKCNY